MDPHSFTVKLIQDGISDTVIGVIVGGFMFVRRLTQG